MIAPNVTSPVEIKIPSDGYSPAHKYMTITEESKPHLLKQRYSGILAYLRQVTANTTGTNPIVPAFMPSRVFYLIVLVFGITIRIFLKAYDAV